MTEGIPSPAPPKLFYSEADSDRAKKSWKATCGPHALAAACGLTLDQVRPALKSYRGWLNPTMMGESLVTLGRRFRVTTGLRTLDVCDGISRVQWEGSWLDDGVHPSVAYHHTHWVAHLRGWVLCTASVSSEWITAQEWQAFHLEEEPRSPFHVTHHYAFTDLAAGREHDFDALPMSVNELRRIHPSPFAADPVSAGNGQLSLSIGEIQ